MSLILTGSKPLTLEDIIHVARNRERVELGGEAVQRLQKARALVEQMVQEKRVVYGLTTGFGKFKNVAIGTDETAALQKNLIMSHAIGVGPALSEEKVRAAILVRVNSLVQGYSGIRIETVERLIDILNKDIYPFVPSQGSVGSSGDLAPLSHIMLVIMGLGEVLEEGRRVPAREVLAKYGLQPVVLQAKEGLALNNGTAVQTGIGCVALFDAMQMARTADVALAMTLEATMGSLTAYDDRIQRVRPHPGQAQAAKNVRQLCEASEIITSHAHCDRVQDSYSLRCAPQVHGACRDGIAYVKTVLEREINSATDNPLLFVEEGDVLSGGNFHGEPIALAMDHLKICVSELANISERRIARMVDPCTSEGLPAFLIASEKGGLNSGYMIAQYTAAALVSENKVLAHPASVDSIPTSANQEDHVSMGTIAARQAGEIVENAKKVIAIEIMCATQALDFRAPLRSGKGVQKAHEQIRKTIPTWDVDRILYLDFEKVVAQIQLPQFLGEIEQAIGMTL